MVQAAAKVVCEPIFEADFLDCSFGFRPGRSAHQALEVIRAEVNRGRVWVVDADIASFFDSIRPEVLRQALEERISDRRVLGLLMGWLRAGVWTGQALIHPESGTAARRGDQPLMANVVLHRLDRIWVEQYWRWGCRPLRGRPGCLVPDQGTSRAGARSPGGDPGRAGLVPGPGQDSLVDLREPKAGFDFLGFPHRRVESFTRKGRYFCARWPSDRAVGGPRSASGRTPTAAWVAAGRGRRGAPEPVPGRGAWLLRLGNSHDGVSRPRRFVVERLARFISGKHGRHGRGYGLRVMIGHDDLGLVRLVGSVRHGTVHAVPVKGRG